MRVRNLVWALLFFVPGVLFASANLEMGQQTDTKVIIDNALNQASVQDHSVAPGFDALNLEEGSTDEWWGGGWGGGFGGGFGWGGGCGWGWWACYPYWYYPWYWGFGWGGGWWW